MAGRDAAAATTELDEPDCGEDGEEESGGPVRESNVDCLGAPEELEPRVIADEVAIGSTQPRVNRLESPRTQNGADVE